MKLIIMIVSKEKISSIRVYNGNKFTTVDKVMAGDIFASNRYLQVKCRRWSGSIKEKV